MELGSNGIEKTKAEYTADIAAGMPAGELIKKWGKKPYWFFRDREFICPPASRFQADFTDSGIGYQWLCTSGDTEIFGFNVRRLSRDQRELAREMMRPGNKLYISNTHYLVVALQTAPIARPATGVLRLRKL